MEPELITPMMQQYLDVKKDYPDCLVFYRMGDFYELFLEDAKIGSAILDITLTSRNKGSDGQIPMCGVPFHSVDQYLAKIVQAGYKAAICEQISKPTPGKELVQRKVIRIITPGTITDENMLDKKKNNYFMVFVSLESSTAIAYSDITSGIINIYEINQIELESIKQEIKRISPSEVILDTNQYGNDELIDIISQIEGTNINHFAFSQKNLSENVNKIKQNFNIKQLGVFNLDEKKLASIEVAARILEYTEYTQKSIKNIFTKINVIEQNTYMKLDAESILNLEIFKSNKTFANSKEITFINILDHTHTPMGARMLRGWISRPLVEFEMIQERLNAVEFLVINHRERSLVSNLLDKINDIERLHSKLIAGTGNARDAVNFSKSLASSLSAIDAISNLKPLQFIFTELSQEKQKEISNLINELDNTLVEDPPFSIREGRMIKEGINQELDSIKSEVEGSKFWIENLENTERQATSISNLKVGYNSVFGYYIEVSKSNVNLVPDRFHRKQTLVNAERYITQELKEKEEIVLTAKDKTDQIEFEIFGNLLKEIYDHSASIYILSNIIAALDCLVSFAEISGLRNYVKPKIIEYSNFSLQIEEGRHPVVESVVGTGEFSPNSTKLDNKKYINLITGPNMSGKSTYIRQIALIQIMAQIGCFVPAKSAEISIVDAIYTRIGAGDALAQGLSTFMVEMIETAKILNNATKNSLIILDEVGRGTSTTDGLSIAQSVVEYIHNKIGAKTLFATHFHELIDLEQRLKGLSNFHVGISEVNGEIKFLHKVLPGGTDKSYGIEVAKLAGVPEEVIIRAKQILDRNTTNQLKLSL